MSLAKVLFISTFISLYFADTPRDSIVDPCNQFDATAAITAVEGAGYRVEIQAKGGKAPYKYYFYKESGHFISTDFDSNKVEGLQKGKYACTVSDRNNCKKTIDIDIK